MTPEQHAYLKNILGPAGFITDPVVIAPHLEEWRGKYHGHATVMLRPAATAEVSAILKYCNQNAIAVVPQGGNTGLVGGQMPFDGEVILDMTRMRAIRSVDQAGASLTAEAGVILAEAQAAADRAGLMLPLSLAAEGSCTIGGNLSTNAGGVNVLRYGMARDQLLGLEVVLADGRVLDMLRSLRKDNTGYDLKQLFVGAEGTLGIITAATLKLSPKPAARFTAFLAVADVDQAIEILHRLQAATGGMVNAFELVPRYGIDLVVRHMGARDPFADPAPWYILCEVSGMAQLQEPFEAALGSALEVELALDAVIAGSEAQRAALWHLRESMSEAEKREGPSFKHDIAVPVSAQGAFIAEAVPAVLAAYPSLIPVVFGHLGDGNLHFNFMLPKGGEALLAAWDAVADAVYKVVRRYDGTISAEHGIGVMKRQALKDLRAPAELAIMAVLKKAFDPNGILNPGKLLPLV
ncbi:MAG: FAD-binding oxidoreductase [Rhizomicrobium sp.]